MIKSFRCSDTESLFKRQRVKRFVNIEVVARRKLNLVHAAGSLEFLRVPPGNRLEALKGDRSGQHSIRINDQFRVCFRWQMATLKTSKSWTTINGDSNHEQEATCDSSW